MGHGRHFWQLLSTGAVLLIAQAAPALAQDAPKADTQEADAQPAPDASGDDILVTANSTRSVTQLAGPEIQKIMPGVAPLRAIQTLPGVTFTNADPWGNNEQNTQLFIHGFNGQQLGYTFDDLPLGDQSYGNYNGLSPQRAIISENIGRVTLATGAADLGTASTSNLGGAIDTFSSDPASTFGVRVNQTVGSYETSRTYVRLDTGDMGGGNSLYVSGARQHARAWDFDGDQGGYQANAKFVHDDATGKLTLWFSYSDKAEPNEDAIIRGPGAAFAYQPFTRPFLYPDFQAALAYLTPAGAPPAAEGQNYRNYYSAAQRTDYLAYAKYEWRISDRISWSNQGYYHNDDGVGIVAGPITVASLPTVFALYLPGQDLRLTTGNSGYATRTTEYSNSRYGFLSTLNAEIGTHQIELGAWYEHNTAEQYRRWYALDVNHPTTPYQRPTNPLFTQFGLGSSYDVVQLHLQDQWQIVPSLTLQAGFKSSLQYANGRALIQPILGSLPGVTEYPSGQINTENWFLPQIGARWDVTSSEQLFFNIQKNLRQPTTTGGLSLWLLGSQPIFDALRDVVKPETAWTYEVGIRTRRALNWGPLTGIEGQINYYHVDFSDRLLAVNAAPTGSIVGGASIIQNVGDVKTDGFDAALTLRFGQTFSLYNALSYNKSVYQGDYQSGTTIIPTSGRNVPGSPAWLNKTVATLNVAGFDLQAIGDYVGKRYVTYTNDQSVPSYFLLGARLAFEVPLSSGSFVKSANISLNVTNITQNRGAASVSVSNPSSIYATFPQAPRQWFLTLATGF